MYLIEVYVTNASLNVNQLYSYYYDEFIDSFKRVKVLFARSKTNALVINCYEFSSLEEKQKELGFKLLKIISVVDEHPIISKKQFELAKWLSKTTVSPFISCLNSMLPKALKTTKNIVNPTRVEYISKNIINLKLTNKQKEFYDRCYDGMLVKDARKMSASIFNKLKSLKIIEIYSNEKTYSATKNVDKTSFKELTKDQRKAYVSIIESSINTSLIFGITGSGKTEVYLHLAKHYLDEGKQVLILVPEISLTPQMIKRVIERFNDVVFYHSELNDQERYEQYKRILNNEVNIVVGTRSSVFLPFSNLGLIIVDEEHDQSYKQDNTPCYNTINVAKKLALDFNAKVVLASATPSLDSYTRALKKEYNFLTLKERINNKLPEIKIVDLTSEVKNSNSYIISHPLKIEIENNLSIHKQTIILLNRRGYSPIVKCSECGSTLICDACDIPLSYHKDEELLKCHQCGRIYKNIKLCPKCNSNKLIYYGFGTKKVEEELHKLFPKAIIDRMDHDNVSKKGSHKRILDNFEKGNTDILIGTQMIAKGLDYPNVTLVGILNADAGLMHQDYNSSKLTFDLLMQASGRSGRADAQGKVIIQAFNPDHYVLKAVLSQNYEYFYNIEMNYRACMMYPPYSHILSIIVSDANINRLNKSIKFISEYLDNDELKIFMPCSLSKINNLMRQRILIMHKDNTKLLDFAWNILDDYLKNGNLSKIKFDIDPLYLE